MGEAVGVSVGDLEGGGGVESGYVEKRNMKINEISKIQYKFLDCCSMVERTGGGLMVGDMVGLG